MLILSGAVKRSGIILFLSLMTIVTLAAIAGSAIFMFSARSRAVASALGSAKAFRLAEAGIEKVAYLLKNDPDYISAPYDIVATPLGDGTYEVIITGPVVEGVKKKYTLVSTGKVGNIARSVSRSAMVSNWGDAFTEYGAFGGGLDRSITLDHTSSVIGDVCTRGTVFVNKGAAITGLVYAEGGVTGSGQYTLRPRPDPFPVMPTLTTTYYEGQIYAASQEPLQGMTYSALDLAGLSVYVNGDVTISHGGSVTGPGILVMNGNFTLSGAATIGQDIMIISNATIDLQSNSRIRERCVLYSTNDFSLKQSGVIIDKSAVITPGNIYIWQSITMRGALYCGGNLDMKQGCVVTGAAVVGGNIAMTQSASIVCNNSALPDEPPVGLGGSGNRSVVLSGWGET